MDERRELPRWQVKKEAKVWLPQLQEFFHCIIEDIHLKGMCASFNKPLPQQQPLKMSFALEDGFDFVKFEADLPWMKESEGRYVYGLSFSRIKDWHKERIDKYIMRNCSDQFRNKWFAEE